MAKFPFFILAHPPLHALRPSQGYRLIQGGKGEGQAQSQSTRPSLAALPDVRVRPLYLMPRPNQAVPEPPHSERVVSNSELRLLEPLKVYREQDEGHIEAATKAERQVRDDGR